MRTCRLSRGRKGYRVHQIEEDVQEHNEGEYDLNTETLKF